MYRCRICSKEFTEIPPDAVEIAAKRRGTLYQFDGAVHDLRRLIKFTAEQKHKRWHKTSQPRPDCLFCHTPPKRRNRNHPWHSCLSLPEIKKEFPLNSPNSLDRSKQVNSRSVGTLWQQF